MAPPRANGKNGAANADKDKIPVGRVCRMDGCTARRVLMKHTDIERAGAAGGAESVQSCAEHQRDGAYLGGNRQGEASTSTEVELGVASLLMDAACSHTRRPSSDTLQSHAVEDADTRPNTLQASRIESSLTPSSDA